MSRSTARIQLLRRALSASVGLGLVVLVSLQGQALAPSTFESADGNLVVDTAGHEDWCLDFPAPAGVCAATAPNFTEGIDATKGSPDNAFANGAKEDDIGPSVGFGGIPPNKDDFSRFYTANERVPPGPPGTGDIFLYLAWERTNSLGSAHESFELNQKGCPSACSSNGVTPQRTGGDVLITYDFEGGSGSPPVIGAAKWQDGSAQFPGPCGAAKSPPCWGPIQTLTNADAQVNLGSVTDPINPGAPRPLIPLTFGEAGINLSASGLITGCEAFTSTFLVSRSSGNSFKSTLKDFVAPVPTEITNCVPTKLRSTPRLVPNDTFTLTGGFNPGGSVTFQLFAPTDATCSGTAAFSQTVPVSGDGDYSTTNTSFVADTVGTWRWLVTYSGDGNNEGFTIACGVEHFELLNSS